MSEDTPTAQVHYEVGDGVATITLDSPHNRNALSRALVSGLFDALERAAADEDARVVVIAATGSVFCSGADLSEAAGGSMVMVAKGNRAGVVREACEKHGGFYLASIGGSAANLAEHCIKKVETLEYPELGMEAVWRIEVVDFPAFIVIDDKGNDFFKELNLG